MSSFAITRTVISRAPRLSVRSLHSSSRFTARLIDDTISLMRGKPQAPPLPPQPQKKLPPRLSLVGANGGPITADKGTKRATSALSPIDQFILSALKLHSAQGNTDLTRLSNEMREMEGKMLDIDLAYESEPLQDRKINVALSTAGETSKPMTVLREGEQDGVVIIAHVIGTEEPIIELSSGFAIGNRKEGGESDMIMSVSHTLHSIASKLTSPATPSAAFAITSSGHVYSISCVLSSFNSADLIVYQLSPSPLRFGNRQISNDELPPRLKSLPISPYPPPSGSPVASFMFSENARTAREWIFGRIVEYKDQMGRSIETGTYDELSTMSLTVVPRAGASGSPIIDVENGSVVGIMRGSSLGFGDRMRRGFAAPAEKIFEMFRLPGFRSKNKAEEKKEETVKVPSNE